MDKESIKSSINTALSNLYLKNGVGAIKNKIEVTGTNKSLSANKIYLGGVDIETIGPKDNSIKETHLDDTIDLGTIS